MNKDAILGALPALSHADLKAVQTVVNGLLGAATGPQMVPLAGTGALLYDALQATLGLSMPYSSYSLVAARQFNSKVPIVEAFLNEHFKGWDKKKTSQMAFLRMLTGLLADDLKARRVNPTMGIMVSNLPRLPEVFDNAFPSYRMVGLGHILLKNFQ